MRDTDVLRERVAGMSSDELADVLTVNPNRYGGEVLELARRELERRGFIFRGHGDGGIVTPDGVTLRPRPHAPLPAVSTGPSGVGGWLLLYVIGHLTCRPLAALDGIGPSAASISQLAEGFPTTALILNVDKILSVVLMLFGVVVAFALCKKGSPFPVRLAKIYLAVYPLACMFLAALYSFNDFNEYYREAFVQGAMRRAALASVWSLAWTLYFNKSKRVRATYFPDESSPTAARQ